MPHGQCFLWQPAVLWLNVGSDLFIAAAYYIISASLFYFLYKRQDVPFKWMFGLFGLFIMACGTTHVMGAWTVWHPDYWVEGTVKAATALLSFSTGLLLVPLLPKAMALRSPMELEQVNADLTAALTQRQQAYETLQASQAELFRRTDELTQQRQQLRRMASQLTMTEQRERRRLAAELHDYLAQLLVVCRLKVSQAKRGLAQPLEIFLEDLNGSLDQCLKYTRTLVSQLCPTSLYEAGLVTAIRQLATQMEKHGLQVSVVAGDRHISLGDEAAIQVYQTVRELLFNILKHAKTDKAEIRVHKTDGNEIEAIVQDRGAGFDPSLLLDRSATDRFGLFSVRERIETLHGRFEIRSAPGAGTTAILTLPLPASSRELANAHAPLIAAAQTGPALMPPKKGMIRVVLVDDHAMVRQGLRSVLEGYPDVQVLGEACDGEEALTCVGAHRPSVVVMDLTMPKMDGIEATRRIKARYPEVTIIGLSVNASGANHTAMLQAGAAALLTKEEAVDMLYAAIRQAMVRAEADT